MATIFSREAAEAELLRALSRQIGYTTGAFSLLRMARLVSLFTDSTAYHFELVKLLQMNGLDSSEKLTEKYTGEILNFVSSLGILKRLPGTNSAHLTRYGLTDAGVAIRAAECFPALKKLVLTDVVLENDADAYILTLRLLASSQPEARSDELAIAFRDGVTKMRKHRLEWCRSAFPNKTLLYRFIDKVPWIKRTRLGELTIEEPKADFGRHHFSPRKRWAVELGHVTESNSMSTEGAALLSLFDTDPVSSMWLSPPPTVLTYLRINNTTLNGPHAPSIDLLRPPGTDQPPTKEIIEKVADFLESSFPYIRLVHARQASTAAARYFLNELERKAGFRISWDQTVRSVSQQYVGRFSFFSSRQGHTAYYQVRRKDESS
jgi:hypothetical protein